MRLQVSLLVSVMALAVAVAGCGSSSSSSTGGADPAASVPAGTPVYVEAAIRPEGSQGDAARALIEKFLPPGKTLAGLLDDAAREQGGDVVFSRDVQPWLGERVGLGVADLTADNPTYVAAADVTDEDKATAFLSVQGAKKGSHDGTDLYFEDSDDGTWAAVHDGVLVLSDTQAGVEKGLDAQDGKQLSDSKTFQDAIGELPDERLGTLYVDAEGVRKAIEADTTSGAGPAEKAFLNKLLGDGKLEPITGALTATESSATVETRFNGSGLARLSSLGLLGTGQSTELVRDAPADAFAVFGAKDVGRTLQDAVSTYAGALGGAALTGQLQQFGIDLQRDVYSWVGDVAVYARGTSTDAVNGAVVIGATSESAAATALPRLVAAAKRGGAPVTGASVEGADQAFTAPAPGAPGPVVVARKGDRVVAAFGADAAAEALDPSSDTLGDSGRYDDAKAAVDDVIPSLIVSFGGVLALVDDAGNSNPDYGRAKPYLQKLDQIVTGSEKDGDTYRSLLTVTTK